MSKNKIKRVLLTAAALFAAIALSLQMACVKPIQSQEVAALDVQTPGAATPFLKIFGKETIDVYLQS